MNILITGVAGFIGSKLSEEFLRNKKNKVYGVDNINSYYSIKLKKLRLKKLNKNKNFKFYKFDLKKKVKFNLLKNTKFDLVYHFAAQAGVRFTLSEPKKYFDDNFIAFLNILDFIKENKIKKFFFASSSSVYGDQKKYPLSETIGLNEKNFYGFSKRMNETIALTFSNNYKTQMIGLRFFTVFGEWGRPDMLIFKYLKKNIDNKKFILNEGGKHFRDFTYIDDVVKILIKLSKIKIKKNYEIFNICSNKPVKVRTVIDLINSKFTDFKFISKSSKQLKKIEVRITHGNNNKIKKLIKNYKFKKFKSALSKTIDWYLENNINKIT